MDVDDRVSLAGLLRRQMARRGYVVDRLAKDAGVPRATLRRWLSGQTNRSYAPDHALRVADTLRLTRAETNALLRAAGLPLLSEIAAGTPPAERAALARWLATARNNLPAPLTSFIGRDGEVVRLAALLCEEQPRLVTLTGPGGSGKTRLALRVAGELLDAFPDGVVFVPLDVARDPADVPPGIMRALEVPEVAGRSPLERLGDYLRERRMLLLLDNMEQVVAAGPGIAALLQRAPGVKALVTSRVPLHVYGEHLWPVEPLPPPTAAAQLFAARATAANPAFRAAPHARTVADICARLDGLPLAIELAAARSARFTPPELLERFPKRLDVSSDGPSDVDERQRTLRATIAWSVDLLSPAAQQLVTRLSAFEGGWTAEAAAEVCADGADVADGLATLREASLIVARGSADQPRFHMLETIREYMAERLAADGAADAVHARHARFYLEFVAAMPPYPGSRVPNWIAPFEAAYANIRAALRWLLRRDPGAALRLAGMLWPVWMETGRLSEGSRGLRAALEAGATLHDSRRAPALAGLAVITVSLGDYAGALELSEAALRVADEEGDAPSMAILEVYRGIMAQHGGDLELSGGWYRRALEHYRTAGLPLGEVRCHHELALVEAMRANWEQSDAEAQAAATIAAREHDRIGLARSVIDRGLVTMMRGDFEGAIAHLLEGVESSREGTFSYTYGGALLYLGLAQQFVGRLADARGNLTEALRGFTDSGDKLFVSYCLVGLAGVAAGRGHPERAARLCGAAFASQSAVGVVMPPAVRDLYQLGEAKIRAQLTDEAFAAAFARGEGMSTAEAVAYALETGGDVTTAP